MQGRGPGLLFSQKKIVLASHVENTILSPFVQICPYKCGSVSVYYSVPLTHTYIHPYANPVLF